MGTDYTLQKCRSPESSRPYTENGVKKSGNFGLAIESVQQQRGQYGPIHRPNLRLHPGRVERAVLLGIGRRLAAHAGLEAAAAEALFQHRLLLLRPGQSGLDPQAELIHLLDTGRTRFHQQGRSEERRVGKECRSRWSPYPSKK